MKERALISPNHQTRDPYFTFIYVASMALISPAPVKVPRNSRFPLVKSVQCPRCTSRESSWSYYWSSDSTSGRPRQSCLLPDGVSIFTILRFSMTKEQVLMFQSYTFNCNDQILIFCGLCSSVRNLLDQALGGIDIVFFFIMTIIHFVIFPMATLHVFHSH